MTTVSSSHTDVAFVSTHIDLAGNRGKLFGGKGAPKTEAGTLSAPKPGHVLWRVIVRPEVVKKLIGREIGPAEDGQSVAYSFTVDGGDGGLMPIEEPGVFKAEIVAAFAPVSFLPVVGKVEIIFADSADQARGNSSRQTIASPAQLEGRLIRLPAEVEASTSPAIWFVEHGVKRLLESPTCARMRFGEGWQRLVQRLPSMDYLNIVSDGPPLTLAECAEGKIITSWPNPEFYVVEHGKRTVIDAEADPDTRFGAHWRIRAVDLRPAEMELIRTESN